jgi:hypothetical protein
MHHFLLRQLQSAKKNRKHFALGILTHRVGTRILSTPLSAPRTKLLLRLASLHVRGHQHGNCEFNFLSRPSQLNVLADEFASEVLEDLRETYRVLPLTHISVMAQGTTQAAKNARSRTNSPITKSERTSNSVTIRPTTSLIPSIKCLSSSNCYTH